MKENETAQAAATSSATGINPVKWISWVDEFCKVALNFEILFRNFSKKLVFYTPHTLLRMIYTEKCPYSFVLGNETYLLCLHDVYSLFCRPCFETTILWQNPVCLLRNMF
jgi:hypothetical protein